MPCPPLPPDCYDWRSHSLSLVLTDCLLGCQEKRIQIFGLISCSELTLILVRFFFFFLVLEQGLGAALEPDDVGLFPNSASLTSHLWSEQDINSYIWVDNEINVLVFYCCHN